MEIQKCEGDNDEVPSHTQHVGEKQKYKKQNLWFWVICQSPCWGPASAGSRFTLRMNGISERKREIRLGMCSGVWQMFIYLFIYFLP